MSAYRLFLLMSGVNALALDMAFTLNLVYQVKVVGLGPLQLVLVGTVLELVLFVAQIPTGVIADLYSRRLSVVLGYVLMAAGLLVWGLLPAYVAVLVANAIWAVGWTCVDGAQQAWAADEIGEASVGKAFVRSGQFAQGGRALRRRCPRRRPKPAAFRRWPERPCPRPPASAGPSLSVADSGPCVTSYWPVAVGSGAAPCSPG